MLAYSIRQGENQRASQCVAHWADLSLWQLMQGFGIPYFSVIAGVMKRNVWAWTKTPGAPSVSIFGMWHETHKLPWLPGL